MSTRAHPDYGAAPVPEEWTLRLYVTDWTPRCVAAYRNLKRICQEHVKDRCNIEVVDLLEDPAVAKRDQIVAVPTLRKVSPKPERVLIGDFTRLDEVLKGLDIKLLEGPDSGAVRISSPKGEAGFGPNVVFLGASDEQPVAGKLLPPAGGEPGLRLARSGGVDGHQD